MEQRPLRLGDIVDDYCPRERRITNHAIVALVGVAIRQTRCTTCDAEHVYKGAREPRLRKKPTSELYDRVLPNSAQVAASPPSSDEVGAVDRDRDVADAASATANGEPASAPAPGLTDDSAPATETGHDDIWPAHRQLIRATLPKTESDPPIPRPIPEFTMHQRPPSRSGRGFRFSGNGHPPGRNGNGFGQGRPGPHSGRRHRGKKRSR
jgi:hypothetical protein